jgi:hypothetical protein
MAVQDILRNSPPEESSTNRRAERALALYEERGHLIRSVASDTFEVPSCGMVGKRYTVQYGGGVESCSCKDFEFGGGRACKHLLAVGIRHASWRSGVKVRTIPGAIAGDPFAHAAKRRRRRPDCIHCYGSGCIYDALEDEAHECHMCGGSGRRV